MDCKAECISYADTGYFSSLIVDYLEEHPGLEPFYTYSPQHPDFRKIIEARRLFPTNRSLLVHELQTLYQGVKASDVVRQNIESLAEENTFTVCTAHQPNLFTGFLYFTYKILHAVKLAAFLTEEYPEMNFVPVYYMGSEDNDLEELGTVFIHGKKYQWKTEQSGAVGRMQPEGLEELIGAVTKDLREGKFKREIIGLIRDAYLKHDDIQTATLHLVNALFGRLGLLVINADTPGFKRAILPLMKEELFEQKSHLIVKETSKRLMENHYFAQATPRAINLFYLDHQLRERIIQEGDKWKVLNTDHSFSRKELEKELETHPERFSPNVILRGVLQETILPNLAFIGGGGELAYWMELKALFEYYKVPFPLLMLRHSVLWADLKSVKRLKKIGLSVRDLFDDTERIVTDFVKENSRSDLFLKKEYQQIEQLYEQLITKSSSIDSTLRASTEAERAKSLRSIKKLEKKNIRAEKRKFEWQTAIIREAKEKLFPNNGLQERVENILPFYAVYGPEFIDRVYENLTPINKDFLIIEEQ